MRRRVGGDSTAAAANVGGERADGAETRTKRKSTRTTSKGGGCCGYVVGEIGGVARRAGLPTADAPAGTRRLRRRSVVNDRQRAAAADGEATFQLLLASSRRSPPLLTSAPFNSRV